VQKEKLSAFDTELVMLRSAKIENEAKIEFQTERIRSLMSENETF